MFEQVKEDVRFFHALRYPGQEPTWATRTRLALSSRGLFLLTAHRFLAALSEWGHAAGPGARPRRFASWALNLAFDQPVQAFTKSDVRVDSRFDGGVYVSDRGYVIVGARVIGSGTVIHDRVTIGWGVLREGTPHIGKNVWIGPGAVVLGGITIGDGATILANTVLTRSVPPRFVVGGNPARFVHRDFDNAPLRATLSTDVQRFLPGVA